LRRAHLAAVALAGALALSASSARADSLPEGYLVWSKGNADDAGSRKIHRLTLPGKTDERVLTGGEDVEPQISPDGRWVAYAKAKFPGGSDYHDPKLWRVYLVSIHGAGEGRREIKIDDEGAWPTWSKSGALYFNQADGTHTRLVRVELDDRGRITRSARALETRAAFGSFGEINELAIAPDESWVAARTRGNAIQNGVRAFTLAPPGDVLLARAGDVGCMPRVSPNGSFAVIAGATQGIRWGHGPQVAGRQEDQLLIPIRSPAHLAYHPDVSTDGRWVLSAQGTDGDHNAGRYDVAIHALDPERMTIGDEQLLAAGGFNGWPHLWVGAPSEAPPPSPEVSDFHASSYTVAPGEKVTLTWSTFGADEVLLDGSAVAVEGAQEVAVARTTTFNLAALNTRLGSREGAGLTVVVNPDPQPVAVTRFEADPPRVERGRSTRLRWSVDNATTLLVDGRRARPSDELEVTPSETTTYVLIAEGHAGPARAEVTVPVDAPRTGLLPDRGGFRCHAGGDEGPAGGLALALLPLAWALRRHQRRRSSPGRR
jgi:hypothetical protein